ncbi:Sensor histidine kinase LiaS [Corynebacterium felinum]|uniref:Signal transduction histidine kinase n=2 Tax=Corynebacterium felinum TaxID=131318 RepID=A0ABU2B8M2_9CORY|nr:signal transduction histidine kinase [Corynebacterium felinum]WJY96305.1 Sensor histidine kinase LiaS [Corynebacterium felinum]
MDSSLESHVEGIEPNTQGTHDALTRAKNRMKNTASATLTNIAAGDVNTYDSQPGAAAYRRAMTVLTVFLLVAALADATRLGRNDAIIAVVFSALFAFAYAMAVTRADDSLWLKLTWLAALTIVWVLMLPVVQVSVYLVFPLFFLYLRVLPDYRGMIAVLGATAVAILSYRSHLTYGAVMGPGVSALVVIGIHLAFQALWRGAREREALIAELIETRSQLAETERAAGIAAERQRIAHEIHDTLAQGLSSIQMLLRVSEQAINKSSMTEDEKIAPLKHIGIARQTAADNLQEARAMIAALQPAALSKTSLEGALLRVAESFVGPDYTITVDGDERQLPMKVEAALLRIGQGAMGNVAKHASATRCAVTLTYSPGEVRLDVVDNGAGFDPAAVEDRPAGLGHIGVNAMRQRAAELGGTVELESAPGQGTAVSVAIPIPEEN